MADKANRVGVAERCPEPAVQKSLAVDRAPIGHDDARLRDGALAIGSTATHHTANPLYLRRPVPGIGAILSLVRRYDSHAIQRFPRGQDVLASCRLVTCAKASAGKRYGTSGTKSGHAARQWACSAAAVLCLRNNAAGQKYLARLEKTPGTGQALTV